MGQVLHGCATTTEAVRRAIQHSRASLRELARRYGVNAKTISKWRKRSSVADQPTGPREAQGTKVVIPSNGTRRRPYPLDRRSYRRRSVIEPMFCRMKDWRLFATRYDRHARNFLSSIAIVVVVCFWIT